MIRIGFAYSGLAVALAALIAAPLAACGKQGDLERPVPRNARAATAADPANATSAAANEGAAPGSVRSPEQVTRDNNPAPPRTVPIEGTRPDPAGGRPPGGLPDPYSNPGP